MTPDERATAMAAAKVVALPFASAVLGRRAHQVQLITAGMSRAELAALAIIMAAAADPPRLRVIAEEPDDGLPEHVRMEARAS